MISGLLWKRHFHGTKTNIQYNTYVKCSPCQATGAQGGKTSNIKSCTTCHGSGTMRVQQGFFVVETTCHECRGEGAVIKDLCRQCRGSGRKQEQKTLALAIPGGVDSGSQIRLTGEGAAGIRGWSSRYMYVVVDIKEHEIFKRKNHNIYMKVPITMTAAVLGDSISVPSIDGKKVKISIPAGTQPGTSFRLKNQGMSILRSKSRGDMYVEVSIEIPVSLTDKQKALLEEFAGNVNDKRSHPQMTGFFNKIKSLFADL